MEVVHRASPLPHLQLIGCGQGAGQISLGATAGVFQWHAVSKGGGDRRRQGAAGAMGIAGLHARRCQPYLVPAMHKNIGSLQAIAMPPLYEDCTGPEPKQHCGLIVHRVFIRGARAAPKKAGGFLKIGRNQIGKRDQPLAQNRFSVRVKQRVAAGGDHDRIQNDGNAAQGFEPLRHDTRGFGASNHTDLHGPDIKITEYRVQLGGNERTRQRMYGIDAARILGGQRGQDTGPVNAKRGKGFQIRLNARAA